MTANDAQLPGGGGRMITMGGTDATFVWTWGAGHGSNTPLNTTQNGTIDAMMAKYAE